MGDFKSSWIRYRSEGMLSFPGVILLLTIICVAYSPAALAQKPLSQLQINRIKQIAAKKTAGDYDRDFNGPCRVQNYLVHPSNRGGRRDCLEESYWCTVEKKRGRYPGEEYIDPNGLFQRCTVKLWQYAREGRWNAIPLLRAEFQDAPNRRPASNNRTRPKSAPSGSSNKSPRVSTPARTAPVLDHGEYMDIDDLGNTEVLDVTSPPPTRRARQRPTRKFCLCKGGDIEYLGVCNDPSVRGAYNTGYYPWTPQCKNPVSR